MKRKVSGQKSIVELVKLTANTYPKFKNPLNRNDFSEYVIKKFVGDFMYDPKIKGTHEEKIDKAKALYLNIMNVWEELYGQTKNSQKVD